ncbi:MAG: hypothetical protein ACNA8W_02885 [Bradymonadaceae bacterium]
MNHHDQKDARRRTEKLQSPYPGLQTILPQLAGLNVARTTTPTFKNREEAEYYKRKFDNHDFKLVIPVWTIDHVDLRKSKICTWSLARYIC